MADRTWVGLRRQARVSGWAEQNHTAEEIAGIEKYLATGDKTDLPQMYKDREPTRIRGAHVVEDEHAESAANGADASPSTTGESAVPPLKGSRATASA